MGRNGYLPLKVDETNTLSMTRLKQWGYLVEGQSLGGVISWYDRYDAIQSQIGIRVTFDGYYKHIQLKYTSNGIERNYKVDITSLPSNLGKGKIWYFVCPKTGLLCRKLYFKNGFFYHRKAHSEFYYQKQVYSHKDRYLIRHYDNATPEKAMKILNSKNLKKTYGGRPTKKYLWAIRKMKIAERYTSDDITRMIMGIF